MAARRPRPGLDRPRSGGLDRFRLALTVEERVTLPEPLAAGDREGIARFLHELLRGADREHLVVLFFDAGLRLSGYHVAHVGTVGRLAVEPYTVFVPALLANARAVIVAHNHPSGSTWASFEDVRLTRQLAAAGEILGVPLLDHLVLGQAPRFASVLRCAAPSPRGRHHDPA